jgi:hypothetical protein
MDDFSLYRWGSLLMMMGPAYYWWGYPAPIFIAGIALFIYLHYTSFTRLFATSVLVINSSINKDKEKDESKVENLHG